MFLFLSVSDFELANDIKIIITTGEIKVISSDSVRLENYTLYNIYGTKVLEGNDNVIQTSSTANGIYILNLYFDKGVVTKKILVH